MKQIAEILQRHHFRTTTVSTRQLLRKALSTGSWRALLIVSSVGDADGLALCREVRAASRIPIIQLVAAGDHLSALEAGADYCLSTTVNTRELLVHLAALLRRSSLDHQPISERVMSFNGWRIDAHRRHLSSPVNSNIALSAAEFDLLLAFCRQPGRILSRQALLEATHIGVGKPMERSVDVHLSRLRRKLAAAGGDSLIKTVRLGGYIFTAPVEFE